MNKKISAVLGVVILLGIFLVFTGQFKTSEQAPTLGGEESLQAAIPDKLGDFTLAGVITGEEAIDSISRLHGTEIAIIDGYEAKYEGDKGHFMVWVSQSREEDEARQLLEIMDAKIPASSVFTGRQAIEIGETTYYYVTGAGMENYYWYKGTKVYWVGINAGEEMEILRLVIDNL